ncbi:TauD/TfdA family dioxygenase [Sphingorhabdus sp. Alg231-15]|uniref:TauD/TfdA family dioxygenase n=1 Tax=Sphingorhabdus sp. Alg231-15 TaxID=1922222 RepID=UPI000D55A932
MLWEKSIDFKDPKPAFDALVEAWRNDDNKVFVLRGAAEAGDVQQFYTESFSFLGTPIPLAEDVRKGGRADQRTGQIWTEVRFDPDLPDAYRHSCEAQPLHTDGSYIPDFPNATLMVCVANAAEGGETTFIDSEELIDCLSVERLDLLTKLEQLSVPHSRSGDSRVEKIINRDQPNTLLNFNYYCVDKNTGEEEKSLANDFFDFLQNSVALRKRIIPVKLNPGDAVTWKDRAVLHGRNGFKATKESERFLWKCAIDVGNFV